MINWRWCITPIETPEEAELEIAKAQADDSSEQEAKVEQTVVEQKTEAKQEVAKTPADLGDICYYDENLEKPHYAIGKAAVEGDARSQFYFGLMYYYGDRIFKGS